MSAPAETVLVAIPRSALRLVEAPPVLVSQRTSERVLGIGSRQYLAELRAFAADGGAVIRSGKLRLARLEDLLEWLGRRSASAPAPAAGDDAADLASELGIALPTPRRRAR